jgi:hypothetical protein
MVQESDRDICRRVDATLYSPPPLVVIEHRGHERAVLGRHDVQLLAARRPCPRVALTPGCQIGYMENTGCHMENTGCHIDHTGCHVDHTGCHVDHTGCHHLVFFYRKMTW